MPVLIHRLPFGPAPPGATLPAPLGDPVPLLTDQIILWASITPLMTDDLRPNTPIFPLAFDPGFNGGFLIPRLQLMSWTAQGVYEHCFANNRLLRASGELIPCVDALVWLYPNRSGTRDVRESGTPLCLELPGGIAVTPPGSRHEKALPLLGLAAVRFNNLRVHIDGRDETVTIEVP